MSADSVPSPKTNIFQSKLYTLIYCRHFRTYSRCAMFDWSDTVFRRRNVTLRRISNTVLQPRYWGSEADSPEVCRLQISRYIEFLCLFFFSVLIVTKQTKKFDVPWNLFTVWTGSDDRKKRDSMFTLWTGSDNRKKNKQRNSMYREICNRQTSGESASLPQYLGCNTVFDMRLSVTFPLPVHSVNIESLFFRSSLPVHTVNRFHGTSNFFVCLVTIKTDINLHKTCTYYKIELKCSYISRRTTHFWNK
jgi:hypothetical protein